MTTLSDDVMRKVWSVITDRRMNCAECRTYIFRDFSFCATCGTPNAHFSQEELKKEGYTTVEDQRQALCPSYHSPSETVVFEEGVTQVDWIRENPFCPFCGTRIEIE